MTAEGVALGPCDVEVTWGSQKCMLHLAPRETLTPGHPRWGGQMDAIMVEGTVDIFGAPMVWASIEFPQVLDPMDGYEHTVSSDYCSDAASAVASLYAKTQEIRAWLDGLVSEKTE